MELRLLGPFELGPPGSHLVLPGRGERALLTLLALAAGRTLAAVSLIDVLWPPGDLPDDPANALQIRVSRLRRSLAAAGGGGLVSRHAGGYRLDVDPADIDVHEFAALIEAARGAADPLAAITHYDGALSLWRGDPLVDFATESWTAVEVGRLTELRYAAFAQRAEKMLALGRFEELVADLEPVVASVPTRERLVGQLMTALFNAGRQADALEAFARTRKALTDDLGLDPSPELRNVMEQILRHDPAIAAPATVVPVVRIPASAQARAGQLLGNLPLRATSFVGRDREMQQTVGILEKSRLLTLVGPGGAGKTTLAIEAARQAGARRDAGAWLIRLAAVSEPAMVVHAVGDALGISLEGHNDPQDAVLGFLRNRSTLLVLDNCEHVIDAVATLAEAILARCAEVRLLTTSREPLAVPGEVQLPVSPLPVPDREIGPGQIMEFPSAQLFMHRANAASVGLVVDDETLSAVGVICRRLDGIPLALELAAARLTTLTPVELADRLHDRFRVLTTGPRTADARQQTLRSTVDWSHDLLTSAEQILFRRLAVFRGGWQLTAAEQVVPDSKLPAASVLDLLDRLVRQSLVFTEQLHGHTRYRMLETLRHYAADKLDASGERDWLAGAHAACFVDLGERAEGGLRGALQSQWMSALREEHANLRAAIAWLTDFEGGSDGALRLAGSLGLYWHLGRHLEGRAILRAVLARPGGSPHARARALQAVSLVERPRASLVHPSEQCAAAAQESMEIFDELGDRPRAAFSRLLLAVEGVAANPRVPAAALLAEAQSEFLALGDQWGQAVVAYVQMETLAKRGDEGSAREAAARAIGLFRSLGDGGGVSAVLYHFGWALERFGRYADAVPVLEEAIVVATEAGVYNTVQWATADLGLALLALGRVDEAHACFDRAGAISDQVGDDAGRVLATYGQAVAAHHAGDALTARPLFEQAHHGFERLGVWLATGLALAGMASCDELLGAPAAAREGFKQLLELGETAGEIGLIAGGLEGVARAALADGEAERAAELLGRAAWLRRTYDRPADGPERAAAERAVRATRAVLGEQRYAEAARRGAAVGLGSLR